MLAPNSVSANCRDVRLNSRPPSRSSSRATARDTVGTDTPITRDAAANDPSSATLANMANPSKSGSLLISFLQRWIADNSILKFSRRRYASPTPQLTEINHLNSKPEKHHGSQA